MRDLLYDKDGNEYSKNNSHDSCNGCCFNDGFKCNRPTELDDFSDGCCWDYVFIKVNGDIEKLRELLNSTVIKD